MMLEKITTYRRDLHRIPEVGHCEHKTQAYLKEVLSNTKAKIYTDFYSTAVIAHFVYQEGLPTLGFRADMDALSLNEVSDHDYVSEHPGSMHACGHDGHMAILLALADDLDKMNLKAYNIALIFQPAEEGPGGAQGLIASDLYQSLNICRVYGYHLYPGLKAGQIGTTRGAHMAATSEMYLTFKGQAAHGAEPHKGKDALVAACDFVMSAQTIVSRKLSPMTPAVVSFGKMTAGERVNIVAPHAHLEGTMRSYDDRVHSLIQDEVAHTANQVAKAHHMDVEVKFVDMYPAVINNVALADEVFSLFAHVQEIQPVMLAEDFSYFCKDVPSLFMFLGIDTGDKGHLPLHHNAFDFDEKALVTGVESLLDLINHLDLKG